MRSARSLALVVVLSMSTTLLAHSQSRGQSVGKEEATQWTRWVIPMPHEIVIDRKVLAPAAQIAITLLPNASLLEREAADELADVLARKTGARINVGTGEAAKMAWRSVLGCCDKDGKLAGREVPGAARLWTLPNPGQAYRIVPLGARTLGLGGPRAAGGLLCGQDLEATDLVRACSVPGQVAVPMAEVTDWPDLAERGLWGGSANEDIEWLAERKMNLVESHVGLSVGSDGHGVAAISDGPAYPGQAACGEVGAHHHPPGAVAAGRFGPTAAIEGRGRRTTSTLRRSASRNRRPRKSSPIGSRVWRVIPR